MSMVLSRAPAKYCRCALLCKVSALASSTYNLLHSGKRRIGCPGAGVPPRAARAGYSSRPQQTADLLGLAQHRIGNLPRPLGAAAQNSVDVSGVGHQAPHLAADSAQDLDRQIGEGILELREVAAGKAGKSGVARQAGERGVDDAEVVDLRPAFEAVTIAGKRLRIRLRPPDFQRDRIGVVGHVDARIIRAV